MKTNIEYNAMMIAFDGGPPPNLLYITKQSFVGKKHDRPIHSHDDLCELLLVRSGSGFYLADGRSYPLREGDIILANQDTPHEVIGSSDTEISTYCFAFSGLRFAGLPANYILPPHSNPVCNSGERFPFLCDLCEQAYIRLGGSVYEKALAQSMAVSFLLMAKNLKESIPEEDGSKNVSDMPFRIRRFLDEHFIERLTIEDIASEFRCSKSYVSHACKESTGYSPIMYVIRRRIGLAQTLLITTDYSVARISSMVGYDDPDYFSRQFTKIAGLSPVRYKEKYLESMRGTAVIP